jgi:hypothetical protein
MPEVMKISEKRVISIQTTAMENNTATLKIVHPDNFIILKKAYFELDADGETFLLEMTADELKQIGELFIAESKDMKL